MLDSATKKRVDDCIVAETGIDPVVIDVDRSIREQANLDSMQFVGLVARIEIELATELPVAIMQVSTLREFYAELDRAMPRKDLPRSNNAA